MSDNTSDRRGKFILGIVAGIVVCAGALVGLFVNVSTQVPDFSGLKTKVSMPVFSKGKKTTRTVGPQVPGWVPISQISNAMLAAVIASEDTSFYQHKGVDFFELREAIKKDVREKRWARGASTLTQQLVKNVYLNREKTIWRKFKEILWARELEKNLTKSEILAFYLNMAEWGAGIYGIGQASQRYFSISPSELTPKQSAFLAMLLPSPVKYQKYYERKQLSKWADDRIQRILKVMNGLGFLDELSLDVAKDEPLWPEMLAPIDNEPAPASDDPIQIEEGLTDGGEQEELPTGGDSEIREGPSEGVE